VSVDTIFVCVHAIRRLFADQHSPHRTHESGCFARRVPHLCGAGTNLFAAHVQIVFLPLGFRLVILVSLALCRHTFLPLYPRFVYRISRHHIVELGHQGDVVTSQINPKWCVVIVQRHVDDAEWSFWSSFFLMGE